MSSLMIYAVGHSTHGSDEFAELLQHYRIGRLIDVRTIPRSRHNPQFNKETLAPFLCNRGISYEHLKDPGGLRRARADSPNAGWRSALVRHRVSDTRGAR